jgi:hypothetical protein
LHQQSPCGSHTNVAPQRGQAARGRSVVVVFGGAFIVSPA